MLQKQGLGGLDIFVLRLDQDGRFQWANTYGQGGPDHDRATSVATDVTGNVYVTGTHGQTVDFDPGLATTNDTLSSPMDHRNDVFVLKLAGDGSFVWVKGVGGPESFGDGDIAKSIAVDLSANVYLTGRFFGEVDFNPAATLVENRTSLGTGERESDIFVLRLDALGAFDWVAHLQGAGYDQGNSISVDSNGAALYHRHFQG